MKFLIDRCAGKSVSAWLRTQGHDVADAWATEPDPGDAELLARAAEEERVLVTIDKDCRIEQEIVVDAYTPDEVAMSWYYHLEGKLVFPFKARCIAGRAVPPLKKGEEVEVLGMAPEDDCMRQMFVIVGFAGRKLGVPLAQLEPVKPDKATREAVEDWRYWVAMEYGF